MKPKKRWMRHFVTANLAIGATLMLFLIMQALLAMESPSSFAKPIESSVLVPFPELIIEEPVDNINEASAVPELPILKPDMSIPKMDVAPLTPLMFTDSEMTLPINFDINLGIDFANGYSQYLPQVQIQPIYPHRALRNGIKGFVIVELTVSKSGRVKDPIIRKSEPKGVFDLSVLQAVRKYRFKPKLVNDEPTEVTGVTYRINFDFN